MIEITLVFVMFVELLLSVSVLSRNSKDLSNRFFSLLSFSAAIWTFSNYMTDRLNSVHWLNTSYALGAIVICLGLIWVLILTIKPVRWWSLYTVLCVGTFFAYCSIQPNFITSSSYFSSSNILIEEPGWGLLFYAIYYFTFAILIIQALYKATLASTDRMERRQLNCILAGAFIALVIVAFNSLLLPFLFSFSISSIDNIGFLIFLILILLSIKKYHLFNIKVIFIEIILCGVWVSLMLRVIFAPTIRDLLVEVGLFLIVFILGILLIQNMLQSIRQREEIEALTGNLRKSLGDSETP